MFYVTAIRTVADLNWSNVCRDNEMSFKEFP